MKHIFLFVLVTLFSLNTSIGQSHHEINKLDKEVELLLDSAAKHMVSFILTQKEAEYTMAMERITKAEALHQTVITKTEGEKGLAGKIEKEIIEERNEEFESYKNQSLKSDILNEKSEARKIKVKFKGQTYYLSQKSKQSYDLFLSYLPKN